jgi:hypothetical protein
MSTAPTASSSGTQPSTIKQEPHDDDPPYLPTGREMARGLRDNIGGKIFWYFVIESDDLLSNCCGEKILEGDPVLTNHGRSFFGGSPTTFHPSTNTTKFFHPDTDPCLEAAMSDGCDLRLVQRQQKASFPVIRKPCDTCNSYAMSEGGRQSIQVHIEKDNTTHVFCSIDHARDWYLPLSQIWDESKDPGNGELEEKVVRSGSQFQLWGATSVNDAWNNADEGVSRIDSTRKLIEYFGQQEKDNLWE